MRVIEAEDVHASLEYDSLIDRLEDAFRAGGTVPERHHHRLAGDGAAASLILMPAWREGGPLGIKTITVYPGNRVKGLPSLMAVYLLLDGGTGEPRAVIDGTSLTLWRTAAASALASRYLSRPASAHHLMVGAGALAPHLVRAHARVRPIVRTTLWNHHPNKAAALAERLQGEGLDTMATEDLEASARDADIISCATLSPAPLIRGAWLKAGAHLDLVGAFTPAMRESDDEAVRRARLYVDTRAGALKEGGDMVDPIERGVIAESDIIGDLYELARGEAPGRQSADEITLFKSVGTALEDLAAAELVFERMTEGV